MYRCPSGFTLEDHNVLPRVLEPEVMDTPEDALDYDSMDHSEVNARFVADFLAFHEAPRGRDILDLGTGTALIPIVLCQQSATARVVGVDLAEQMLLVAARNVDRAGLADRIRLDRVDAKGLPYPDSSFEAVLSNSIVHHIPEPMTVIAEMVRLVCPGGSVFVRDLARPEDNAQLDHLVQTYAGKEGEHARSMFQDSLLASLTVDEVKKMLTSLGIPDDGAAMTSDRHWTWTWRRPEGS